MMTTDNAAAYHSFQIECMAAPGVDVITAVTMGYVGEAIGIVRAARAVGLPVVVSFTLETDGRLPSGMSLGEAIETTDAATSGGAQHFMINCAHPTHFTDVLDGASSWSHVSVGYERTRRPSGMRSSTRWSSSTKATQPISPHATSRCVRFSPRYRSSAVVVAPTTATSPRSRKHGMRHRHTLRR